jgi:hypothetical protein
MAEDNQYRLVPLAVVVISTFGIIIPAGLSGSLLPALVATIAVAVAVNAAHGPNYRQLSALLSAVIAFAGGILFWYPFWRTIVYHLLVKNPGGLQWFLFGSVIAIAIVWRKPMYSESDSIRHSQEITGWGMLALALVALSFIGLVITGPLISGMYAHEHMANQVEVEAENIEELPNSDTDRSRIVPQGVAKNWGENSLQYPQYNLAGGDITYLNGTPHWSYSLAPDGVVNTFTLKQRGAVYVNQSSFDKDITVRDEQRFTYGQGMAITDHYEWQLSKSDYLKEYQDPFVVPHDGESYLVVPYVTHSWEFRLTPIPQLYAVPEFGGVKVIHQDGAVEDMSPSEAQDSEILGETQNYYPYSLAKFKVESMAYENGIVNTWFGHEDQIEVAPVPGDGNNQPFTVPTQDEGIQYFVAAEPWGEANGVYEVWTIDAQTGEMQVKEMNQQSALRGPRKAVDSVMAHPEISRLNDVKAVEPIPVVVDGDLYWQVRVIPNSSARITYLAFFNAQNENVAVVESTSGVNAFLSEQQVSEIDPGNETQGDGTTSCDFTIVVEYPDGSTETICVPDGGSVTITGENSTAN